MEAKWPELKWHEVADRVARITYRVYAGDYVGTAFNISVARQPQRRSSALFATALHVLEPAITKNQNVTLVSSDRSKTFSTPTDAMHAQPLGRSAHDTVLLMLESDNLVATEEELLPILPYDAMLARGAEVAWMGFPGVFEPELCFFHGHVSGYRRDPSSYLIDGVALGGVSGGPAFDSRAHLVGLVSAYIPNRVDSSTTLPGVLALVPINLIMYFLQEEMRVTVR